MSDFSGCYTVMVTPFTDDGAKVDYSALRRCVDWQISNGVPGLIPLGSTGEFLSVSEEERREIVKTVVEQADGRAVVLAGTADEWTDGDAETRDATPDPDRERTALGSDTAREQRERQGEDAGPAEPLDGASDDQLRRIGAEGREH